MTTTTTKPRTRHPYITRKKGTCGGKPIIAGTRIKVSQIAIEYERMGMTPDEIVEAHPHLTLPQIHDALSYYYENVHEINADIRAGEQFVEEMKKLYPRSVLEEKRARAANIYR
ncbi:MAG: DUF433 domain-containing protein [Planctomycetes bacterium]|nr:DUF433 domain-containing protein [Planctomycetota bacterium]